MKCQECESPDCENLETWSVPTGYGSYHVKKLCDRCSFEAERYWDDKVERAKQSMREGEE